MWNILQGENQIRVLPMLVEVCSIRSVTRITGVHRTTGMNLKRTFVADTRQTNGAIAIFQNGFIQSQSP